jgi:hypothetical protein
MTATLPLPANTMLSMKFVRSRRLIARLIAAASLALAACRMAQAQGDTTAALHYKGITVQPIGYAAAEFVWRQRNISADIGSSYSAIPFSGTTNGNMTEARFSGRQSRIGLLATGNAGPAKVAGYWESDFLSSGTSSNSNESNSYSLRIRQFFVSAALESGWTISGGQMWSLMTPDKNGMNPRSEAVPLTIEAQYAVGFNWARQAGVRFVKQLGDQASFGVGLEESQSTFSARNAPVGFIIGQAGGSLLNATTTYSTDYSPDVVAKLAFDPKGWGHWELKAVGSAFRDRVFDPTNVNGGIRNATNYGFGLGFGVWVPMMAGGRDMLDVGLSGLWGQGIGRYGTAQLPDVTIGKNEALTPIAASQLLLSLEAHPTKTLDVYSYVGAEYAGRSDYVNAALAGVGYGSALNNNAGCQTEAAPTNQTTPNSGACNADTRAFWQANLGFWYRFYKGAAGTVQWGMQYSYTSKNSWDGVGGVQPQAIDNMVFSSFRYVLP